MSTFSPTLFFRYLILRLLQLLALFFFLIVPLFFLGLRFYGLPSSMNYYIEEALDGKFFEVKVDHFYFSLRRGFIVNNLRVLEKKGSQRLLVHAKRLSFLPKLTPLLSGHLAVESFHLRGTTLDIPLGNQEEPRLHLDHVSASIIAPQDRLVLNNASFTLAGLKVEAAGTFLHPEGFAPNPVPEEGPGKIAQTIEAIQKELSLIKWKGRPGIIRLRAGGDLRNNNSLKIDQLTLHANDFLYRGWPIKKLHGEVSYGGGFLELQRFLLQDEMGEMTLSGGSYFPDRSASLYFSGTSSVIPLLKILRPMTHTEDWQLIDPPYLQGALHADWSSGKPFFSGNAQFSMGRFFYRNIRMQQLHAGCAIDGDKVLVRDLVMEGDPGKVDADVLMTPDNNKVRLHASFWPQLLAPAVEGNGKIFLKSFTSEAPLTFALEGAAPQANFATFRADGKFYLGRSAIRGAWIDELSSNFHIENQVIDFRDVLLRDGERKVTGECFFEPQNQIVRFAEMLSSVDPLIIMEWIDPKVTEALRAYRFRQPPQLKVAGIIGVQNPQKNDLHITVNSPEGLRYELLHRDFSFTKVTGNVSIQGEKLVVDIPQATLFGGGITLQLNTSISPDNKRFRATTGFHDVDLKDLTKLCFHYDDSQGKLDGNYHFETATDDEYSMLGEGSLLIHDGNVLGMPVFGPLSSLMNEIVPGLGYQTAHKATADFSVQHGTITSKNIGIQGTAFTLIGDGVIFYLEDRMLMNMRLNVKGVPGLVFFPVSKLFEFTSKGSLENPDWHPKFVPIPKIPLPGKKN